jgi:hypothetical protein
MDHATLAGILSDFAHQLLSAQQSAPAKTEPDHPKAPPKGRRR